MFYVSVRADIRAATKWLTNIQRRQIPFATSNALTCTAFDVRKRIVKRTFPRAFNIRNKRFPAAAMRVKKATKRRLLAVVYDRLGRASLALHASGGTKRPKGRHLAVPQNIKRTAAGRIGKARRPRAILAKKKVFKGNLRKGTPAIFERYGRKGRRLRLLYSLTPSARITKRFRFCEDGESTARRAFPHNFKKSLARALATAR